MRGENNLFYGRTAAAESCIRFDRFRSLRACYTSARWLICAASGAKELISPKSDVRPLPPYLVHTGARTRCVDTL